MAATLQARTTVCGWMGQALQRDASLRASDCPKLSVCNIQTFVLLLCGVVEMIHVVAELGLVCDVLEYPELPHRSC